MRQRRQKTKRIRVIQTRDDQTYVSPTDIKMYQAFVINTGSYDATWSTVSLNATFMCTLS